MTFVGYGFCLFGILWAVLGFASYSSDIQIGIALIGICMFGIGLLLISIDSVKKDLVNIWLWIKKIEK
jgi:hypothetical protein